MPKALRCLSPSGDGQGEASSLPTLQRRDARLRGHDEESAREGRAKKIKKNRVIPSVSEESQKKALSFGEGWVRRRFPPAWE